VSAGFFNHASQRCRVHGSFRCVYCLAAWARKRGDQELGDCLEAVARGSRSREEAHVLAFVNKAWRQLEAEEGARG
jgi:hypothetical protein